MKYNKKGIEKRLEELTVNQTNSINAVVRSFEHISNEVSQILILGTMPSVQSRNENFYYANPRNRFWLVIARCLGQNIPITNTEKINLLLENFIALWDILDTCEIKGSDDSTIKKPVYNNILTFIRDRPIKKIICNGKKAYNFCQDYDLNLPVLYAPSTSPANAKWSVERLIDAWKPMFIYH